MTRVRPAFPFPPHGVEDDGVIDLGIRLRDSLFRRRQVEKAVRSALVERLNAAVSEEDGPRAAVLVEAIVDTWPVAHLVDDARETWARGPDGRALAVLHRAAVLTGLATGSRPGWPRPGPAWAQRITGSRLVTGVQRRHADDGAEELAELFEVEVEAGPALELAAIARVPASDLASRRAEIGRALALGELAAVQLIGALPDDPESQLAAWEVELEGDAQLAVERYGVMATRTPGAPAWSDLLVSAPAGTPGPTPRPVASVLRLPGTLAGLRRGHIEPTPWLVWDGPVRPVPVTPGAAAVVSNLDGVRTAEEVAAALGAPIEPVRDVIDGLISVGAATA